MSTSGPRPRSKTFTGCWTCRARKIKCDLKRPICGCCVRSGRACQGYGIHLYWVRDDETVSPSVLRRQTRSLALGNPHWPPEGALTDVDEHLLHVQQHEPCDDRDLFMSGPFGVFMQQSSVAGPGRASESRETTGSNASCCISSRDEHDAHPTSGGGETRRQSPAEPMQIQSSTETRQLAPHRCSFVVASHHDMLVNSLLSHYLETVANILQPVKHPRNAYSSLYGSRAMSVAKRFSWNDAFQNLHVSDGKLALLCSLLASASFHLRESDKLGDADATARFFRSKAISHLRQALSARGGRDQSGHQVLSRSVVSTKAVLSVTLTLVTADILDGQMSEFWIHLDAAQALVAELRGSVTPGSSAEHLINIYTFLQIMSDSTNPNLVVLPWTPGLAQQTAFLGGAHSLEFTYGITATLADLLRRAILLARNKAYYTLHGLSFPEGFTTACDDLWRDLSDWDISQEPLPSFPVREDVTALLVSKHILAFAAGIRVYFHARVSPCDELEMQSFVECVATHLISIEAIKRRTGYDATPTAVVLWPGFIASAQASLAGRRVWTEWWNQMHDYHIGNIQTLWSIVQESWEWQDTSIASPDDVPWAFVLARDGRRILAI